MANYCKDCRFAFNKDANKYLWESQCKLRKKSYDYVTGAIGYASCNDVRTIFYQNNPICPDFVQKKPWYKRLWA